MFLTYSSVYPKKRKKNDSILNLDQLKNTHFIISVCLIEKLIVQDKKVFKKEYSSCTLKDTRMVSICT